MSGETRVYDVVQQLALPDQDILDRYQVDVIDVCQAFATDSSYWKTAGSAKGFLWPAKISCRFGDGTAELLLPNGRTAGIMPRSATFFDQTIYPFEDGYPDDYQCLSQAMSQVTWSAFVHSPWDAAGETDFYDRLRQRALWLRRHTDKALMIVCGCNLFEWGTFLRRIDNFLADLVIQQEDVERLLDALLEHHMSTLEKVCASVGDVVDIIRFGDDLGMDTGPFLSPEIYRKLFKPRHKMLCDYVKTHSSMHTFLHSCGSIHMLLPDLIEAGFEIINPVQSCCRDMEPARLKREFGDSITFWGGGVDTRSVLNRGTPEEVRRNVLENMEALSRAGGFVFAAIHNILPDVPPENIEAMFQAVDEFNRR